MKGLKVLVADDEQVIRELFTKFLGSRGYTVSTAVDGLDAMEKIKRGDYNMLLLDLKMPRMGGMEVLSSIKEIRKDIIIIVITGYASIDTAKEAIRLGCFDYITKPLDIEETEAVIRNAFEVKRHDDEKKKYQELARLRERFAVETEKRKVEELAALNEELSWSNEELSRLKTDLEQRVDERTVELREAKTELEQRVIGLEKFNRVVVNRELRMIELKQRVMELEDQIAKRGNSGPWPGTNRDSQQEGQ